MIADDHPTFREGLCHFINEEPDMEVVGTAACGEEAIELAKQLQPNVVVLDVILPGINGVDTARQVKADCPQIAILMLSAFGYESYVIASLRAGAAGYLMKNARVNEIVTAIRLLHSQESVFNHKAISKVLSRVVAENGDTKQSADLQSRELEVLRLGAKGMSNRQIGGKLCISERTVQAHMMNIFRKLQVSSRTEAVLHALREGWLNLDDLP